MTAVETRVFQPNGIPRVRFADGWASAIARDGSIQLERLGDETAQLAEASKLATTWAAQDAAAAVAQAEADLAALQAFGGEDDELNHGAPDMTNGQDDLATKGGSPRLLSGAAAFAQRRQQQENQERSSLFSSRSQNERSSLFVPREPPRSAQQPAVDDTDLERQMPMGLSKVEEIKWKHAQRVQAKAAAAGGTPGYSSPRQVTSARLLTYNP